MYAKLRDQFGSAGLVLSVVAIVLALAGGAIAANNSASASKAGKSGPRGKTGKTGPAGPAGPAGTNGTNGKDGAPGAAGSNGVSVTTSAASSGECEEGGVKLTAANGAAHVCNGEAGPEGPPGAPGTNGADGSPWTAGGTLPPSTASGCPCTETGTWATVVGSKEAFSNVAGFAKISTSFNIPLSAPLTATGCNTQPTQPTTCQIHLISPSGKELISGEEEAAEEVDQRSPAPCPGTALSPEAEPGNLCAYVEDGVENITVIYKTPSAALSTPGGVIFPTILSTAGGKIIDGSWAVTG